MKAAQRGLLAALQCHIKEREANHRCHGHLEIRRTNSNIPPNRQLFVLQQPVLGLLHQQVGMLPAQGTGGGQETQKFADFFRLAVV